MKTFVVTGCNGYIGSHMCHELGTFYNDCHILGVDKHVKPYLRHLYDDYSPIDLSHAPLYSSKGSIDCIFHFAAYISVEEGEREPWRYYRNNIGATLGVVDFAERYNVRNLIFSSTAAVYGDCSKDYIFGGNLLETYPLNPTSVYGMSKSMCEIILNGINDINIARLRYFNACGRNVEAGLYEEHDPETHLIPLLVKNKTATIYGNDYYTDDGTCVRDYVHVIDICLSHIAAYEYLNYHNGKNIALNIGSGQGYSVKEVVDRVNKIIHNGEMKIETQSRREGDVAYLVASTQLANMILNFRAEYTLDDIIESMK